MALGVVQLNDYITSIHTTMIKKEKRYTTIVKPFYYHVQPQVRNGPMNQSHA